MANRIKGVLYRDKRYDGAGEGACWDIRGGRRVVWTRPRLKLYSMLQSGYSAATDLGDRNSDCFKCRNLQHRIVEGFARGARKTPRSS